MPWCFFFLVLLLPCGFQPWQEGKMIKCEFASRCWKRAYTENIRDNGYNGQYPTRMQLFLDGYATPDMMQTKISKRGKTVYSGIWVDRLPDACNGWCPVVQGRDKKTCSEYQKQTKKKERRQVGRTYRPWISKNVRYLVARRDRYKCYYCERSYQELKVLGIKTVIDHIIPLSLGGSSEACNLCYACQVCNDKKGNDIWLQGCRKNFLG